MLRPLVLAGMLLLALNSGAAAQGSSQRPTVLAVVPFTSAMLGEDEWLGVAIADILSQQLALAPDYVLVERTRLNSFLAEMELQEAGFAGGDDAARLGRVAKVDHVVYGNFERDGETVTINLILVDLATQLALLQQSVSGSPDRLHDLVAELSRALIEQRGHTLSDDEMAQLRFRPTDSRPALQHFYEAFRHLDRGLPEDAFGAFYAAITRDPAFHQAGFWMARMLQQLGQEELAAIAFETVLRDAQARVEGFDSRLFLAELLADRDERRSEDLYRALIDLEPKTPHSLEAAYGLANLLQRRGNLEGAYEALGEIDALATWAEEKRAQFAAQQRQERKITGDTLASYLSLARQLVGLADSEPGEDIATVGRLAVDAVGVRHSRFFTWDRALDLYREAAVRRALLFADLPPDGTRKAPRGTFLIDPENPVVSQLDWDGRDGLFHESGPDFTAWKETLYAVVVPKGYHATGAELRVTGRILKASPNISFGMRLFPLPMPPNYHNAWIGALYGQTAEVTTLEKHIPFHGENRRFLTLQLTENSSEIHGWELVLHLEADAGTAMADPQSSEPVDSNGRLLSRLAVEAPHYGPTQPQHLYFQQPRRRLALAESGRRGLTLVSVRGDKGGAEADLWLSQSPDSKTWSEALRLPVNAASEDTAPQLLAAEDGSLRLFWLSDRRGRGWELLTSRTERGDENNWMPPQRVPAQPWSGVGLPLFSVLQDGTGRWLAAIHDPMQRRVDLWLSTDGDSWQRLQPGIAGEVLVGLALTQDTTGVYRLVGMDPAGALHLWRSTDLTGWTRRPVPPESLFRPRYGFTYASYLFAEPGGQLLALVSDSIYGLQFARFDPEQGYPVRDLVPGVTFEAFAAAPAIGGGYYLALEETDGIAIRHFNSLRSGAPSQAPLAKPIYQEAGADHLGNLWSRTFAAARVILPDVTAVAAQTDGRVWWGIETGIFSTLGDQLLFSDASQGYPFHTTTEIEPCGSRVFLASRFSETPRVGVGQVTQLLGMSFLKTEELILETAGRVTHLACTPGPAIIAGTSAGEIFEIRNGNVTERHTLAGQEAVTALVSGRDSGAVFAGTEAGDVYRLGEELQRLPRPTAAGQPVQALGLSPEGTLWAAVANAGLFRFDGAQWHDLPEALAAFPRFSVGALVVDPDGAIWLLPGEEVVSPGLARVRDGEVAFLNPPRMRLARPVDLAQGADGALWIGTGDAGLYRLEARP